MTYKIEKGIPLPSVTSRKQSKWPWGVMDIDDSVLFPPELATKARNSAAAYSAFHHLQFARRTNEDGSVRFWRVK